MKQRQRVHTEAASCGRRAFTLIELLVVVAIIAVLAAILFPIFQAARKSAQTASCSLHLKQFGMVLGMYRDDYGGRNPSIWQKGLQDAKGDYSDTGSFHWVITKYASTRLGSFHNNIFKCPAAPWLRQIWTNPFARAHQGYAYTLNETGWTDDAWGRKYFGRGMRDSDILRPKELIVVGDCLGWSGYGIGYTGGMEFDNERWTATQDGSTSPSTPGWTSTNPPLDKEIPLMKHGPPGRWGGTVCAIYNLRVNHRGGANFLFYDGHVRTMNTTYGRNWVVAY